MTGERRVVVGVLDELGGDDGAAAVDAALVGIHANVISMGRADGARIARKQLTDRLGVKGAWHALLDAAGHFGRRAHAQAPNAPLLFARNPHWAHGRCVLTTLGAEHALACRADVLAKAMHVQNRLSIVVALLEHHVKGIRALVARRNAHQARSQHVASNRQNHLGNELGRHECRLVDDDHICANAARRVWEM